ncbi:MAG: ABC transporter permease subunit [Burkholderiales bacterium]|nr:ABC transporter permease subunit [Burkholderiales bacterium]
MLTYILKRLTLMLPTLLGILTITFLVVQFVPGGPVDQVIASMKHLNHHGEAGGSAYRGGQDLSPDQLKQITKLYGFDKPPIERYFTMLSHYARFDLGDSFMHSEPVWTLIKEKLPVTLSLGLWTFFMSYLISIPLGIAKAVRQGTKFDMSTTFLVLLGYAVPGFVLGVALIVLFAGGTFLEWFPLRGLVSDNWQDLSWAARIRDYFWHLCLPLICLAIEQFAVVTMLTKNTFLEEIRKQYVLVARAKGLSERQVLYKHVFRNALLPIITGLPAAVLAALFGGDLLIETLFSLDGIGLLSYESVLRRDFPVVLGLLFITTLLGLVIKLVCDLLYVVVDPRVQFGAAAK